MLSTYVVYSPIAATHMSLWTDQTCAIARVCIVTSLSLAKSLSPLPHSLPILPDLRKKLCAMAQLSLRCGTLGVLRSSIPGNLLIEPIA